MSKLLNVSYEEKPCYQIALETDFNKLNTFIKVLGYEKKQKVCIISDTNVAPLYLQELAGLLEECFGVVTSYVFEAGEARKNVATIQKMYQTLIENQFDRKDVLIALGGGVVGDMCGFAAATYLRGIDFIQIPTSLLAQVDSSIGGKTGVDFEQYKNMVGAFYQPKLVYMNLSVLNTLSSSHFHAGMGEIIKHGLIKDAAYFQWLKEHRTAILEKDMDTLEEMIYRSCNIKREVVEHDPKEHGERALLNFGHTIGHAIEKLSNFQMIHGDCVAIGIVAASYLSAQKGLIHKEELADIITVLQAFSLPLAAEVDVANVLQTTKLDKKMESGAIKFILLKQIGSAFIDKTITDDELSTTIQAIQI